MGRNVKKSVKKFAPKLDQTIKARRAVQRKKRNNKSKNQEQPPPDSDPNLQNDDNNENDVTTHQLELENLKNTQSEFFEFLEKEGSDLLNFDVSEDSVKDEEEETPLNELTPELLEKWKQSAEKGDIGAIKMILGAFRVACHISDEEDDDNFKFKFSIVSSDIFNDIIIFCIKEMGNLFNIVLGFTVEELHEKNVLPHRNSKWKKIKNSVKLFLTNLFHFLEHLTEYKMIVFILKATQYYTHYLTPYPKLARSFLKKLLNLWGSSEESVRIVSYMNIRNMALKIPYPFINDCLKGIYLTYVKNVKFINIKSMGLINFLTNCVEDLYGIDFNASYQHAFVYIREIAIHLRKAYSTKTQESHESVYNWQTFNSVKVWAKILVKYPNQEDLKLLLYPLIQVIQGIIHLVPSPRYYPLRIQAIKLLIDLGKSYESTYINSASYLLDIVNGPLFQKEKYKPYSGKPLDFTVNLKAPDNILNSKSYINSVLTETHDLLLDYLTSHSYSIAFPELILPIVMNLKKFVKSCKVPFFTKRMLSLIDKINLNAKYVLAKRNEVNFGPNDIENVKNFLSDSNRKSSPLEKYAKIGMIRKEINNTDNNLVLEEDNKMVDDNQIQEDNQMDENNQVEDDNHVKKKRKLNNMKAKNVVSNEDVVEDLVISEEDDD